MTYDVLARIGEQDAVVIARCNDSNEQRRVYRQAVATLRDGGYAEEVTAIEMGPAIPPAPPRPLVQEAMEL